MDYYHAFPDCKRCRELRLRLGTLNGLCSEEFCEAEYYRHLVVDHHMTPKEILDRFGVIYF
jgi:hypothetical protein